MCRLSKYFFLILLLCHVALSASAQEPFRVMFYNVENLFDTEDDPQKDDDEFLPEGIRRWSRYRYKDKINKIARVILASGGEQVPDLVGLCEVENDTCLRDMVKYSPLREAGYRYVMTDSPDERGIDVALLYQRSTFKLIERQSISVPLKDRPTRDILHVAGRVLSGDTLDVLVCHFPSRSGGEKKSEPRRMAASRRLKATVDSLMQVRRHPYLIIMGDFNDRPDNRPVKRLTTNRLKNLLEGKPEGTYRYRGHWETLDQLIVSENLLEEGSRIHTSPERAVIFRYDFLLEEDDKYGGMKPFRTYNGMKHQGGYSDHLPIAVDLTIRDDRDCCSESSSPDRTAPRR